jgi:hypothetical protein
MYASTHVHAAITVIFAFGPTSDFEVEIRRPPGNNGFKTMGSRIPVRCKAPRSHDQITTSTFTVDNLINSNGLYHKMKLKVECRSYSYGLTIYFYVCGYFREDLSSSLIEH